MLLIAKLAKLRHSELMYSMFKFICSNAITVAKISKGILLIKLRCVKPVIEFILHLALCDKTKMILCDS
jgi:hypothetical protein